jgi:hypothetical protein
MVALTVPELGATLVRLNWECDTLWYIFEKYDGVTKKFPDRVDNEIYAYNNKHSLRSNTKGHGGKTH